MNYFWTNSIWYIILALISIVLLSIVLTKSKRRKRDFGFFVAVFGLTLIIETVIYVFFRAYEYFPHFIPNSPPNDGVMGNLVSQFSISSAALFVCVFKLPFRGVVLSAAVFYFIEKLFLLLGIYQHYWYKTWMTFVGIIILFEFIKRWYSVIFKSNSKVIQYITTLLGVLSLYLPTTNWIGILSGYFVVKANILIDPFISHAVVAIPKYLIQMNIIYFLYNKRANWIMYSVAFAVLFMVDVILYYTNLMHVKDGFLLIYSGISFATVYLYVYCMNKLIYSK